MAGAKIRQYIHVLSNFGSQAMTTYTIDIKKKLLHTYIMAHSIRICTLLECLLSIYIATCTRGSGAVAKSFLEINLCTGVVKC